MQSTIDRTRKTLLDSAAEKIRAHNAEPWVFVGDPRVFAQFAGDAEREALKALTQEEHLALLGEWSDQDWAEALCFYYSMTSKEGA